MIVRVGVDAMGGDRAPGVVVRGASLALGQDDAVELVFVGDERHVRDALASAEVNGYASRIRVLHASQVIGSDEAPVEAFRGKHDSSLARLIELAANGEVDAVVSAGHTGAFAAACQLRWKRLAHVSRPGIAVTIPTYHGPLVLCDAGANIQAKPRHLRDYAVMAAVYARRVFGIESPRVALISIGEERGKGTNLVKEAHGLLRHDRTVHFVGNVEGSDLFENRCDVAVCDGFVGNIVLKLAEGMAEGFFRTVASEFDDEEAGLRERIDSALDRIRNRHDYARFGGAPLLGVNGVCIICHGRSNEFALCNAVKTARRFVEHGFNDAITDALTLVSS